MLPMDNELMVDIWHVKLSQWSERGDKVTLRLYHIANLALCFLSNNPALCFLLNNPADVKKTKLSHSAENTGPERFSA
jgi:hypothetical protein